MKFVQLFRVDGLWRRVAAGTVLIAGGDAAAAVDAGVAGVTAIDILGVAVARVGAGVGGLVAVAVAAGADMALAAASGMCAKSA